MAKFKVGDRVRASGSNGPILTVEENDRLGAYPYMCKFPDGGEGLFYEWELELVEPKEESNPKPNILQEADSLTAGDRGADYGHPEDDYAKTGMIWGALLHKWSKESAASNYPIPVPPELACLMMVGVKLSREVNKHKHDNLVDGCGYLRCVEMIHEGKGK